MFFEELGEWRMVGEMQDVPMGVCVCLCVCLCVCVCVSVCLPECVSKCLCV